MSSNADQYPGRVGVERTANASPGLSTQKRPARGSYWRRPIEIAIFAQALTEVHEHGLIYRGLIGGNGIALGLQQRPQLEKDQTSDRGIALERARQSARGELQRGNLGLGDDGCRPGATIDD